ncbi:hypothetical protein NW757_014417, partial [Fusarium falciforme]
TTGDYRPTPRGPPGLHPPRIRTHICEKLGAISNKIWQVFPVRSGWAVQTADPETSDYLVEKQSEWAADLGATAIETKKTWFTYVISDFPRRLTDFRRKFTRHHY